MLPRLALTLALAVLVCPMGTGAAAFAQSSQPDVIQSPSQVSATAPTTVATYTPPAHVSLVDGTATLEREGRAENPLNMPLLSGDRLKTTDGRLEILFTDGSTLHMDRSTTLDVQSDELVRLIDGRVRLTILGVAEARNDASRTVAYRVDSPAGSVRISEPGEYRVAMLHDGTETQVELAVIRGTAEVFTDQGTTAVRAGERAYASAGLAPSYTYAYNSASMDGFDRWSEARHDVSLGVSSESAQYLPTEMRPYASTFDEYGDWQYAQGYGNVWYPRVATGWRPYFYGRWVPYPGWGWTWVGVDGFGWPTHHFGRWGFSSRGWFWIPGVRWAPAWVSWGFSTGFVSWCPLGFNNFPVISINIFNLGFRHAHFFPAWTVVSRPVFGHGFVHAHAVNWDRAQVRTPFALAHAAPVAPRVAVPRGTAPVSWAGTRTLSADRGLSGAPDRGRTVGSTVGTATPRDGFRTPQTAGRELAPSTAGRADARVGAPARDAAQSRTQPTAAPSRNPSSGGAASTASRAVPRYINRGDQIVRSQTERPSAPAAPMAGAPGRTAGAIERNGAVRTQPPAFERAPSQGSATAFERGPVRVDRPGMESRGVAQPRMSVPSAPARTVPQRTEPRGGAAFESRGGFETRGRAVEPRGAFESRGGFESRGMAQPRMAEPRMQVPQAPMMQPSVPMRQPAPAVQPGARQAPQAQPQPSHQGGQAQPRSQSGGGGARRGRG